MLFLMKNESVFAMLSRRIPENLAINRSGIVQPGLPVSGVSVITYPLTLISIILLFKSDEKANMEDNANPLMMKCDICLQTFYSFRMFQIENLAICDSRECVKRWSNAEA